MFHIAFAHISPPLMYCTGVMPVSFLERALQDGAVSKAAVPGDVISTTAVNCIIPSVIMVQR